MYEDRRLVKIGGICGIIAFLIYGSAILLNTFLPGHGAKNVEQYLTALGTGKNATILMAGYFFAAAFGILGIVSMLGLHRALTHKRTSLLSRLGMIYGCIAFVLVDAILIIQGTVRSLMGARFVAAQETEQRIIVLTYRSLRSIDLGLDLVWDVFICISVILFALSMLRSRFFGLIFGISSIMVGTALLGVNIAAAPNPPGSAGLIDLGPLVGLWSIIVNIQMVRIAKRITNSS
jgi:hypothetical protein